MELQREEVEDWVVEDWVVDVVGVSDSVVVVVGVVVKNQVKI